MQAASDSLTFRHTILVYLHVDAERLFDDQWIYVHSPELRLGRVTNFRNWTRELCCGQRTTILAGEFWCNGTDPLWSETDDALVARAARELRSTGLLGDAPLLDGHVVRIPRCYPIYARGYRQHLGRVVDYLRNFSNLTAIGRYGAFKYNNQDHSILMGILAAENLLAGQAHDLWSINSDYESYQEASLITETGLDAQKAIRLMQALRAGSSLAAKGLDRRFKLFGQRILALCPRRPSALLGRRDGIGPAPRHRIGRGQVRVPFEGRPQTQRFLEVPDGARQVARINPGDGQIVVRRREVRLFA